ncbi:hypothetical protein [Marinimicrobium sp. ARAG 43.8]|uniref:hypothetical protein n=1 Tax=Marinimicrobium sp. ARAG 43.8 TaxID=3418719 RepID=UPI003CF99DFF
MANGIKIDPSIQSKLKVKHNVKCSEVLECFANVSKGFLTDNRETHKTNPPTQWFVEQTDNGRWLFIAFMYIDETVVIKTAYDADETKKRLYSKLVSN